MSSTTPTPDHVNEEVEAYMLARDTQESRRLTSQHDMVRALCKSHLIHPCIPRHELKRIADVGTGTGVWLREAAAEVSSSGSTVSSAGSFIGFDISAQQFDPPDRDDQIEFAVHDCTQPFPQKYHSTFDLVHVRCLSYALQVSSLDKAVANIVEILRPGGWLQWQEMDAVDTWAMPETLKARAAIAYVVSERVARGLPPASVLSLPGFGERSLSLTFRRHTRITTPLVKSIQSLSLPASQVPSGKLNPLSWTDDLVRIMRLETVSTAGHPSPFIQAEKKEWILAALSQFLNMAVARRMALAADSRTPKAVSEQLVKDTEEMEALLAGVRRGEDPASCTWDTELTWIVARKAKLVGQNERWMAARHGIEEGAGVNNR